MKKLLGILLGCCIAVFAFGQTQPKIQTEAPEYYKGDAVLAASVSGETLPNGQRWIEISTGPLVTRGIRVYSEPSHTLVAFIVDLDYAETAEGKAWLGSFVHDKPIGSVTYAQLPLARSGFQVPAFPVGDTFIRTFVNGDFFGNQGDLLIGGQFFGTSHTFGGSHYVPKLSKEQFDEWLTEGIHTTSVD